VDWFEPSAADSRRQVEGAVRKDQVERSALDRVVAIGAVLTSATDRIEILALEIRTLGGVLHWRMATTPDPIRLPEFSSSDHEIVIASWTASEGRYAGVAVVTPPPPPHGSLSMHVRLRATPDGPETLSEPLDVRLGP
jgi:hypothetical protein